MDLIASGGGEEQVPDAVLAVYDNVAHKCTRDHTKWFMLLYIASFERSLALTERVRGLCKASC
jgi:hypothetical protein